MKIEGDTYQIAKSLEIGQTAKSKEQLNGIDYEQATIDVKAKSLEVYPKTVVSDDGPAEIRFSEKRNKEIMSKEL